MSLYLREDITLYRVRKGGRKKGGPDSTSTKQGHFDRLEVMSIFLDSPMKLNFMKQRELCLRTILLPAEKQDECNI